jgi:acid phosphatase type 7
MAGARKVAAAAAVALVVGGSAAAFTAARSRTFHAAADGFVSAIAPRASFGKARSLQLRAKPAKRAYLRFRIGSLAGAAASAKLSVWVLGGAGTIQARAVARRAWTERSLTYRRAPALGRVLSTVNASRGWQTLDVSALLRNAGTIDLALTAGSGNISLASREAGSKQPTLSVQPAPVLLAAGDIASCQSRGDEATAALLKAFSGTIAPLGDLAYESGTPAQFANCYAPTWGRFKARSHPALGNHDYLTPAAAGYFGYWGAAAGSPSGGYYSYGLGSWHIVVLNSNCSFVPCYATSPQEIWLRSDLAAHPAKCTLAYWHHPLFSSRFGTATPAVQPLWQALYDAGADVVLTAHSHNYQRYLPQTATGALDRARGIREFVVGTGGMTLQDLGPRIANEQVANDRTWGFFKLTLLPDSYRWRFVPEAGKKFTDRGSGVCH